MRDGWWRDNRRRGGGGGGVAMQELCQEKMAHGGEKMLRMNHEMWSGLKAASTNGEGIYGNT